MAWNKQAWQQRYRWVDGGEEWSAHWGNSKIQWQTCIFPRIERFLPAKSAVEIGPGFGRWTRYLLPYCSSYVGIDLAERCVAACGERFAGHKNARFIANNGLSLPTVDTSSVDFVFSFDSLVHAEDDAIAAYLTEINRVLNDEGVAFIHHSNVGRYPALNAASAVIQGIGRRIARDHRMSHVRRLAIQTQIATWHGGRATSMTADRFLSLSRDAGLVCGQEIVTWQGRQLIDCISTVARPGSRWSYLDGKRVINRQFAATARSATVVAQLYSMKVQHVGNSPA